MSPAANLDWLYALGGGVLGLVAAALGFWALFWDRSRGRRRCPRCWYDMAGVPGMQCPECGRVAKSERRLQRTRRRWRLAFVAAVLAVAAYGIASVPSYQRGGWLGLVPSTVLVYFAPPQISAQVWTAAAARATLQNRIALTAPGGTRAATPPRKTVGQRLTDEVWNRLRARGLARWQSQVFLRRYLAACSEDLGKRLELPVKWPVGEPIPAKFNSAPIAGLDVVMGNPGPAPISDQATWFPARPGPCESARLEFGLALKGMRLYHEFRDVPIRIAGTRDDFVQRLDSEEDTNLVREALNTHTAMLRDQAALIIYDRSRPSVWKKIDFIIHYTFELREGQTVLGTGRGHAEWATIVWKAWDEAEIQWRPGGLEAFQRPGAHLSITIRGDADAATRAYIAWPFDKPRAACWAGEYSTDLELRPGLPSGDQIGESRF